VLPDLGSHCRARDRATPLCRALTALTGCLTSGSVALQVLPGCCRCDLSPCASIWHAAIHILLRCSKTYFLRTALTLASYPMPSP